MKNKDQAHEMSMLRAIALARRGEGLTRPNPPVGAIVVRNGQVLGEGWHRHAGGPHAEVIALREAGRAARGATLYVTLEPCSTWGRTPPCTDAILAAGVRRVVAAARDPNPRHAGRGLALLRRKGVLVDDGICRDDAFELLAPFASWITKGIPYVTLKMGPSLDGRIADRTGSSRWITGAASRIRVQALRRRVDAVMVGGGTVAADNPSLLPRPAKGRNPFRIIVDSNRSRAPLSARVFSDENAQRTILAVPHNYPASRIHALRARGVKVLSLASAGGHVRISSLLKALGREGILHVLCEGGGGLAASLAEAGCVDEYVFFIAPRIIGSREAPMVMSGRGWLLKDAPHLRFTSCERVGPDIMIRAQPGR
jgi:diaminohydroxyphosphoribosylaminopyrimidine deaminase/5-amino-6-(5-phosphoribosylamino)uracil reductase